MWKGIDVSDNQGKIDWKKVKAAGCDFAILRSVRRSGKADYQFSANVAGCQENGIPFSMKLDDQSESRAISAMKAASRIAEENGISNMTLDEINAEISAARKAAE